MTRLEALELIDRMPFVTTIKAHDDKTIIGFYKEALSGTDPLDWIRVVKSYYLRTHGQSGRKMTVSKQEAQYGDSVKKLLEAELAKALNIPLEEVEGFIKTYLAEHI